MPPFKITVGTGIYRNQIWPSDCYHCHLSLRTRYHGTYNVRTVDIAFGWLIRNLGTSVSPFVGKPIKLSFWLISLLHRHSLTKLYHKHAKESIGNRLVYYPFQKSIDSKENSLSRWFLIIINCSNLSCHLFQVKLLDW